MSDPGIVFERLYQKPLLLAVQSLEETLHSRVPSQEGICDLAKNEVTKLFLALETGTCSSIELQQQQIMSQSATLCVMRSNTICIWCTTRDAQHRPYCGHSLCGICVQRHGKPASDTEYRFTLHSCYFCLSRVPLTVDLVPPTKRISILTIDGGGVRGVIALEFLLLIQEQLGECLIQDVCQLIVGTSIGEKFHPVPFQLVTHKHSRGSHWVDPWHSPVGLTRLL